MTVCTADGSGTECDAVPSQPEAELCDGLDQDCDGDTHNGFSLGDACTNGIGECEEAGVTVCTADGSGTECDAVAGQPTDEICGDALDNDCDGEADPVGDCSIHLSDEDGDGLDDTICFSITLFTEGAIYQQQPAYVVGENAHWDWDLLESELVDPVGAWFCADASGWSVGIQLKLTMVSSIYGADLDGDGDVDADDTVASGFDFSGDNDIDVNAEGDFDGDGDIDNADSWISQDVRWLQNFEFCTSGSVSADELCTDEGNDEYLIAVTRDVGTGELLPDGDNAP